MHRVKWLMVVGANEQLEPVQTIDRNVLRTVHQVTTGCCDTLSLPELLVGVADYRYASVHIACSSTASVVLFLQGAADPTDMAYYSAYSTIFQTLFQRVGLSAGK